MPSNPLDCTQLQARMAHEQWMKMKGIKAEALQAVRADEAITNSPLTEVKGLGRSAISALSRAGISTVEALSASKDEDLKKILNPLGWKQVENYFKENGRNVTAGGVQAAS